MKKVTTNITFGQVLFILFIILFASLIFFYLGAKFGPGIIRLGQVRTGIDEPILPDEKMALEIKAILNEKKHDFVFYDALQNKRELQSVTPSDNAKDILNLDSLIPEEILQQIKQEIAEEEKMASEKIKTALQDAAPDKQQETLKTDKKGQIADDKKKKEQIAAEKQAEIQKKHDKAVADAAAEKLKVKTAEPDIIDTTIIDRPKTPYYLQLGSYSKESKARQAQSVWMSRGYSPTIVSFENKDKGTWYRLRMGGYTNIDEAIAAKNTVMQRYRQSARVVTLR
ncbi:MAG: SPOR domain-containing protein [Deltaproteobacteria bacterium]|nr:SPOR domain-containing protein [Deltaproteobacteria bacterium]